MLSLRSAATMLADASSVAGLRALAAASGCPGEAFPLDDRTRTALGIDELVSDASIACGAGTLRALLLELPGDGTLRERVKTVSGRLASRAPHLLWLVIAGEQDGPHLSIATWVADHKRPRIVALSVDRRHILPSDAETLCALAAATGAADVLTHARWMEVLGREALTKRFYRTLERVIVRLAHSASGRADASEREHVALLYVSRLLFLSFLEAKGWLAGDRRFLERGFAECVASGGEYHRRILRPLFFGTLNTPVTKRARAARSFGPIPFLNGGLFARTPVEARQRGLSFSDEAIGTVFGDLLTRYRFTAREDSAVWSDAAIDPEMLGKALESLMASRERRASGAFYTPQPMVARVTHSALVEALAGSGVDRSASEAALAGQAPEAVAAHALRDALRALTVLDPACGSGAFLVHVLEEIAALSALLGDTRSAAVIRREILTRSIFGVDVNPIAVWLCELRLWLSVVIESDESDPLRVPPLPNLDRHIRVGDSLFGEAFGRAALIRGGSRMAKLRERYARSSGARKGSLERALDCEERTHAIALLDSEIGQRDANRRDLLVARRGRDLFGERHHPTAAEAKLLAACRAKVREARVSRRALANGGPLPFSFATFFPDVAERGGFSVVLGNPPWVRLHNIPSSARMRLRSAYSVFGRAAWERGARLARAGVGFAAQVDLAAAFVERSLDLLRDDGTLALLLPVKLWRSLAGGGVRRLLAERARVCSVEDWSESPSAFDAAVYPSCLVARRTCANGDRAPTPPTHTVTVVLHRPSFLLQCEIASSGLTLDGDDASPWLLVPPPVRSAFDRLVRAGIPLAESHLGRPVLGVKCGLNEAFVVRLEAEAGSIASVRATNGRDGLIERELLRPLLRGETLARWIAPVTQEHLIWTHGANGAPLSALPSRAGEWLGVWRRHLKRRADVRNGQPWWSLFRTIGASASGPRVVWADFGRSPRALVLPSSDATVALNSCYVLPVTDPIDAMTFAALLNSPIVASWLSAIAEPARGGYHRYLGWTVSLLPVPSDWARARNILAPLAEQAMTGREVSDAQLTAAAIRAYGVRADDLAPLLAWNAR